jgi:uncharacterized protein (DUF952 family)
MHAVVYKIAPQDLWREARRSGRFAGSADDLRDGFIHLSTAAQVPQTLARHFPGQGELVLARIDAGALGDALRWEASRTGTVYPHHYGPLPMSASVAEWPLPLDAAGRHILPQELCSC